MSRLLQFKPFKKEELIEKVKHAFPNYKVKKAFGGFQIRTGNLTLTGNVRVKLKPAQGEITTETNLDYTLFYFISFFLIPIGIYIYLKAEEQRTMEKEVIDKLMEILPKH